MALKMLPLLSSCSECHHYGYYSSGKHECKLVVEIIPNKNLIAPFCPLADFPSGKIADMAATIRILREPSKYGLNIAILSHLVTKLNTTYGANHAVAILLKNDETVYLRYDSITEITIQPSVVHFVCAGKHYKLYPEGDKPSLLEEFELKLDGESKSMWRQHELA